MREWTLVGMDEIPEECDWCYPQPGSAQNEILRKFHKEKLTEQQIEEIAAKYACRVQWSEYELNRSYFGQDCECKRLFGEEKCKHCVYYHDCYPLEYRSRHIPGTFAPVLDEGPSLDELDPRGWVYEDEAD